MSRIQISNTLVGYCWRVVKPFIAVLVLYSSGAVVLWGSALYWMGADVHGPRYGWSMRQASAMLLVPDNFHENVSPIIYNSLHVYNCSHVSNFGTNTFSFKEQSKHKPCFTMYESFVLLSKGKMKIADTRFSTALHRTILFLHYIGFSSFIVSAFATN